MLWKCPWAYIGLLQNLKKFWTWTQNFEKDSSELCIPSVKRLLELVWYLNPNCHLRYIAWIGPWQIPEMEIAGSLFSNILPIGSGYAELRTSEYQTLINRIFWDCFPGCIQTWLNGNPFQTFAATHRLQCQEKGWFFMRIITLPTNSVDQLSRFMPLNGCICSHYGIT